MKKNHLFWLLFLIPYLLVAQNSNVVTYHAEKNLDQLIPGLMKKAIIPGLSIAIFEKDQVVYHNALGLSSVDTQEPVNDETIFSAASLSKPVFAYAVHQLVEEGRFDLDKPLYQYFPYEDAAHDERYQKITARMVLSHSSGFPNWRRGQLNLLFDPGQKFQYSGEGFVYLMKVIEKLSGQPINDFMTERVFQPLGMNRSSYIWKTSFEDNYAIPHNESGQTRLKPKNEKGNTAYSLETTALDYSKFMLAMLNNKGLKSTTINQMLRPQTEVEGKSNAVGSVCWGLGFGLQLTEAGPAFWHWGDNGTFKCFVIAFEKPKTGLVYFTNSSNGLSIAEPLLKAGIGGSYPAISWIDYPSYDSGSTLLLNRILEGHFDQAIQPFLAANKLHQDTSRINEQAMNRLGYQLLQRNKINAAKRIFAMNIKAYPKSANVYDSYAESCLRNGNQKEAQEYYTEAHKLDSSYEFAQQIAAHLNGGFLEGNTSFELNGYSNAKHIGLAGSFNDWNDLTLPMVRQNGRWICNIPLEDGTYEYKFVVDGVWIPDPSNPKTRGENHNSVIKIGTTTSANYEQFPIADLQSKRVDTGQRYLPFLNRSTLNCGIYALPAGSKDEQSPHELDEVYYVLSGKAKFTVEDKVSEVKAGDILFVAAKAKHHFHDITADLELLVFFSAAK